MFDMPEQFSARSPFKVTRSVLRSLILREAVTRISVDRGAWVWLLLEPAEHIVFLMLWHGLIQHHLINGVSVPLFIGLGVLAFFMMRSVTIRGMDAISANRALFTYRQIKGIDTVLARAILEGLLYLLVGTVLVVACGLFGADISIRNPLMVIAGVGLLWTLGLGMALTFSACAKLVPEIGQIVKMSFGPIYYMSATLYPSSWVPIKLRTIFYLNPIVHAIEMIRAGYFAPYHEPEQVSPAYIAMWALGFLVLGLSLHVRFGKKLTEL